MSDEPRLNRRLALLHGAAAGLGLRWVAGGGMTALGACLPVRAQAPSPANAPQNEDWIDAARRRTLPVRIRWPEASGPIHLVLFSHGLGGTREGGEEWASAWAAAGFAVLQMQHPGSDWPAVRDALATRAPGVLQQVAGPRRLIDRLADVRFVLDEVMRRQRAQHGPWARVRAERIGLAGHSFGAHTTMGMAGQRYPLAPPIDEARLAAFIAFSPTVALQGDPREAYADIVRPMLALTGTEDGDVVGNGATPDRRRAVYAALPAGNRAQLVLEGADHMSFSGRDASQLQSPRRHPSALRREAEHTRLLAAITSDWWRTHLLDDAAARHRLRQPASLGPGDEWQMG